MLVVDFVEIGFVLSVVLSEYDRNLGWGDSVKQNFNRFCDQGCVWKYPKQMVFDLGDLDCV